VWQGIRSCYGAAACALSCVRMPAALEHVINIHTNERGVTHAARGPCRHAGRAPGAPAAAPAGPGAGARAAPARPAACLPVAAARAAGRRRRRRGRSAGRLPGPQVYALVLAGRRSALGAQARGSGPARAARSGKLSDSAASAASCHYCDQKLYSWRLAAKLHYAALVRNLMASSERRTLVACRAWRTVLGAA